MAKTNKSTKRKYTPSAMEQLQRAVSSCFLWENEFYESGQSIADRISDLSRRVSNDELLVIAEETRNNGIRHASLLLLCCAIDNGATGHKVGDTITSVLRRADEPGELLALYWRNGRRPLSAQLKKGLAGAMRKFDEYQLAKYDRGDITPRDVLRLVHPKPTDKEQEAIWARCLDKNLTIPNTWETRLSAGEDKCEVFTDLLQTESIGYLALLRNLRNMEEAGVKRKLIKKAILAGKGNRYVFPFRYIAAAIAAPSFLQEIDIALSQKMAHMDEIPGTTLVLVDVSGSMNHRLSERSDLKRIHAAAGLASLLPCEDMRCFSFSQWLVEYENYGGLAGVAQCINSQPHGSTALAEAIEAVNKMEHDRLVVITDEQQTAIVPKPKRKGYLINVASYERGVERTGWTRINGFSENVIRFIQAEEQFDG